MPVKHGLCCDRCNIGVIVVRMNPEQFPTLIADGKRPPPRRSNRRRTPSLRARELNANMINMLTHNKESNDAWFVTMYLSHNYTF
jgi:hypothetical protein